MGKTKIEWATDVWNPTTGCDRVTPGCDHCYAMTLAPRLKAMGSAKYQTDGDPRTSGPGFGVTEHPSALDQPLRWTRPRRVFVNSMSDLFHAEVSDEFIAEVFAVMALAPQHIFQVLTKRHGRMRSLLNDDGFTAAVGKAWGAMPLYGTRLPLTWPLPNVHLGVSVEDQKWADLRVPALLGTPAAVRWISAEPLLGPVTFRWAAWQSVRGANHLDGLRGLDWMVVGGESGGGARPMVAEWARTLRDECAEADVPFLFKQAGSVLAREWGCKHKKGGDSAEWPEPFPREYPS